MHAELVDVFRRSCCKKTVPGLYGTTCSAHVHSSDVASLFQGYLTQKQRPVAARGRVPPGRMELISFILSLDTNSGI